MNTLWTKKVVLGETWVFPEDESGCVADLQRWFASAEDSVQSDEINEFGVSRALHLIQQGAILRFVNGTGRAAPFVPPTREQWMAEARRVCGLTGGPRTQKAAMTAAEEAYDYYEGCGWTVGQGAGKPRKPMASWKRALSQWIKRNTNGWTDDKRNGDTNTRARGDDLGSLV